jgi:hypothetical protein
VSRKKNRHVFVATAPQLHELVEALQAATPSELSPIHIDDECPRVIGERRSLRVGTTWFSVLSAFNLDYTPLAAALGENLTPEEMEEGRMPDFFDAAQRRREAGG